MALEAPRLLSFSNEIFFLSSADFSKLQVRVDWGSNQKFSPILITVKYLALRKMCHLAYLLKLRYELFSCISISIELFTLKRKFSNFMPKRPPPSTAGFKIVIKLKKLT